jgi:hypothetical protein
VSPPANENARFEVNVEEPFPGVWYVERIDVGGDGGVEEATFSGPNAEARARAYAALLKLAETL